MNQEAKKYFVVAGEPSGDIHGGKLISAIQNIEPDSSFVGHGGDLMKESGMRILRHTNDLAIMGFVEVVRHLPRLVKIMREKSGFILSAFGDEIDDGVDKQFKVLNSLNIGYLDLRKAWGTNVADLSDILKDLQEIAKIENDYILSDSNENSGYYEDISIYVVNTIYQIYAQTRSQQ